MKAQSLSFALVLSFCFCLVVPELADAARRDARQASQRARIRQGVESGELTKKEAAGLRAQQRSIRRGERRAEKDGVVTDAEKARLENRQDRASKAIYRQKHDNQERGSEPTPAE